MRKVDQPNLLLDETVTWECDVTVIPRLNTTPRDYQLLTFTEAGRQLANNFPVLAATPADRHHLMILSTGPYTIDRGNVTLTATREMELRDMRSSGQCGTLTEYNIMASSLPQTTPVYFSYQRTRPAGYSEERYGPLPAGDVLLLKCPFASSHLSPTN